MDEHPSAKTVVYSSYSEEAEAGIAFPDSQPGDMDEFEEDVGMIEEDDVEEHVVEENEVDPEDAPKRQRVEVPFDQASQERTFCTRST